ncbi:MAG TPA: ABC transporter permease [Chloroflexota bacterium]|nr:ABC transporter permease [Chloroflexota bacterium]
MSAVIARDRIRAAPKTDPADEVEHRSYWAGTLSRLRSDDLSFRAGILFCLLCLLCLSAPLVSSLTGYGPTEMDLTRPNAPPSLSHPFGGDEYGRDYLVRTIWAGRVSLTMGFAVAVVAMTIGVTVGLAAGYFGGWIDDCSNAVINALIALPSFFVLVLAATLVPPSLLTLAVIIGALGWMNVARQVRGVVLRTREHDYILAARVLGASSQRIILRHILPNVTSIVAVVGGFEIAAGIMAESGISFIGLGIQPPDASWGNMLTNSIRYVYMSPWLVVFPGAFIFVAVLCVYLLTDGIRDALDPRSS